MGITKASKSPLKSRKERRKYERSQKKLNRRARTTSNRNEDVMTTADERMRTTATTMRETGTGGVDRSAKKRNSREIRDVGSSKKRSSSSRPRESDPYGHLREDVAAALRRDDAEIAELESKLGIGRSSSSAASASGRNKRKKETKKNDDDDGKNRLKR